MSSRFKPGDKVRYNKLSCYTFISVDEDDRHFAFCEHQSIADRTQPNEKRIDRLEIRLLEKRDPDEKYDPAIINYLSEVMQLLRKHRFDLSTEKIVQQEMATLFKSKNIPFEREVRLAKGDIIDFIVGGIGIEIKIKGVKSAIYKQCVRYCEYEKIKILILATSQSLGFPPEINCKSCYVINFSKAWL